MVALTVSFSFPLHLALDTLRLLEIFIPHFVCVQHYINNLLQSPPMQWRFHSDQMVPPCQQLVATSLSRYANMQKMLGRNSIFFSNLNAFSFSTCEIRFLPGSFLCTQDIPRTNRTSCICISKDLAFLVACRLAAAAPGNAVIAYQASQSCEVTECPSNDLTEPGLALE